MEERLDAQDQECQRQLVWSPNLDGLSSGLHGC